MRSSHFSLDFPVISPSNSGETSGKLFLSPLQKLRVGVESVEFRKTPGGRGFLLLPYSLSKNP